MGVAAVIGYGLGVVGVILTIWSWRKPRATTSRLAWTRLSTSTLVNEAISAVPDLTVMFQTTQLERLTMWTGKFWNGSSATIRGVDLRNVRIEVDGGIVLGTTVNRITSVENCVQAVADELSGTAAISIDHLNPGDGAEVTVLHTAPPDSLPNIRGAIVGGRIQRVVATDPPERRPGLVWAAMTGMVSIGGFTAMGALLSLFVMDSSTDPVIREVMSRAMESPLTKISSLAGLGMWGIAVAAMMIVRSQRVMEPTEMTTVGLPEGTPKKIVPSNGDLLQTAGGSPGPAS